MRFTLLLSLALSTGCVDVAEKRARVEDRIGRESASGLTVEVEDGLAAVRRLEPGALELWGQAPRLIVHLEVARAGAWTLDVRNTLSTAELEGVAATPVERPLPTHKAWRLDLPEGRTTVTVAPPDIDDTDPYNIVVFADVQDRLDGVQDLFEPMASEPDVHFGLISGDLTEQGSRAQLERFQREMETLPFPLFATLGNHELGAGTVHPPFFDLFGRGSFSFDYRGARYTLLDAASATIAPRTYDKLAGWLRAGRDGLHLAMMHIPAVDVSGFRNGGFASRAEGHKLLGMFRKAGVDLTVYGHVHTYSTFVNAGIEAIITGGGGAIPQRFDGVGRHYMLFRVEPETPRFRPSLVRVYPAD